ncbi:MAG: hypothetical protein Q7V56_15395 [Gammaproteobacteria bacterium]|nr:hypothetical protein [Gammaproteobacteria bacterium]
MTTNELPPSFSFHIDGDEHVEHTVPAVVLAQILENAQHAFELIGMQAEGREIRARARITTATSKRLQLMCQLPKPGSYAVPVTIGGVGDLFSPELASKVLGIFRTVVASVSSRSRDGLIAALPNERIRRRVLESIKGMAPRAGSRWKLSLHDDLGTTFGTFDTQTIPFVDETLVPAEQREAARVVTGELKSIDFTERKVTIIYPPTSKELACIYEDAVEDMLYERRRDLIQVTGRVLLDDEGSPRQIIDVTDIRDLDLSSLEIDTVEHGLLKLKASQTINLEPTLDETKQLLCIEHESLALDVYAPTRERLLAELNEQIAMLWAEYALADDDTLDSIARDLKQTLLATFAEVRDAAQAE